MAPTWHLSAGAVVITWFALSHRVLADVSNCPGVWAVRSSDVSGCCVGGTLSDPVLSSCSGWPICNGSPVKYCLTILERQITDMLLLKVTTTWSQPPLSCATWIDAKASDYSNLVSSASSSLAASGTSFHTTLGDSGAQSGSTASAGSTGASSGPSQTATSTNAAARSSGFQGLDIAMIASLVLTALSQTSVF